MLVLGEGEVDNFTVDNKLLVLDDKLNTFIQIFNSAIIRLDERIDQNERGEQGIYFCL